MAYDPFLSTNPLVASMEGHRGRIERTHENSARHAMSYATYSTTGVGEFIIDEAYLFGCTFTDQPVVAYGASINNETVVAGTLPRCHGAVRGWVRDVQGHYTGAFVYFTVELPTGATDAPIYGIDHDLTFTAIAMKDLPAHLLELGSSTAGSTVPDGSAPDYTGSPG